MRKKGRVGIGLRSQSNAHSTLFPRDLSLGILYLYGPITLADDAEIDIACLMYLNGVMRVVLVTDSFNSVV